MKKIDKRKKYICVLDTETCPIEQSGFVNPYNMLVYDVGFVITDKKGNIYEKHSYVVRDIFMGEWEKMQSAYYACKIPTYYKQIGSGERKLKSFYEIRKILLETMKKYNCNIVSCHNARFDYGTLNKTMSYLTKGKYRYFFPKGIEIWDTLQMSRDTIGQLKKYKKFCKENNRMTKNNLPRFTAEILYQFIMNELDFEESHTGLEDCLIETIILKECLRRHKKMRKILYKDNKKYEYGI